MSVKCRAGLVVLHYCGRSTGLPWRAAITEQSMTYGSWVGSKVRTTKRNFEEEKKPLS